MFTNTDVSQILNLPHVYSKIIYNPTSQNFLVSCPYPSTVLYVLDKRFREIDSLLINFDDSCFQVEDIWLDLELDIILIATPFKIYKFNYNSDLLGTFMSASKGIKYRAICTYRQFAFLAYEKYGSLYISSYTSQGAYLERICLGSEYSIKNLQVIIDQGYPILRAYVIKSSNFPYMVEIELECEEKRSNDLQNYNNIRIELVSEDPDLKPSCHVNE